MIGKAYDIIDLYLNLNLGCSSLIGECRKPKTPKIAIKIVKPLSIQLKWFDLAKAFKFRRGIIYE